MRPEMRNWRKAEDRVALLLGLAAVVVAGMMIWDWLWS
jgi:hypothetical protein